MSDGQCAARGRSSRSFVPAVLLALAMVVGAPVCRGQQVVAAVGGDLPPTVAVPLRLQPAETAILSGGICDSTGALLPGARVVLTGPADGTRTVVADASGRFAFAGLAPGRYSVRVSSPGFREFALPEMTLAAGETRDMPAVVLGVASQRADVTVSMTPRQVAAEEVHEAEQQRVVGFPDFYTSFAWNAAPLDTGQKFGLALRSTTDRMSFAGAALIAGGEQVQKTFPGYGYGVQGYAKRYGAAYTDGFVGKMIGSALLPSVFRQDPRYFYRGTGTYRQRAMHAVLSAVIARGDRGRLEPNYSHVLGNAAAGAISTLYHPATDSAGKLALDNALLGTLGEAGVNLAREFLLKPFMRGVPVSAARPAP
jgi:hypothetical protein